VARDAGRWTHIHLRASCRGLCLSFPTRGLAAEKLLTGSQGEVEKRLPEAADSIADAADLVDDHEGSAEYKRHLIHVFLLRIFRKTLGEPVRVVPE